MVADAQLLLVATTRDVGRRGTEAVAGFQVVVGFFSIVFTTTSYFA
jgi:hypothetical protein